jgi:hypothetical protein
MYQGTGNKKAVGEIERFVHVIIIMTSTSGMLSIKDQRAGTAAVLLPDLFSLTFYPRPRPRKP